MVRVALCSPMVTCASTPQAIPKGARSRPSTIAAPIASAAIASQTRPRSSSVTPKTRSHSGPCPRGARIHSPNLIGSCQHSAARGSTSPTCGGHPIAGRSLLSAAVLLRQLRQLGHRHAKRRLHPRACQLPQGPVRHPYPEREALVSPDLPQRTLRWRAGRVPLADRRAPGRPTGAPQGTETPAVGLIPRPWMAIARRLSSKLPSSISTAQSAPASAAWRRCGHGRWRRSLFPLFIRWFVCLLEWDAFAYASVPASIYSPAEGTYSPPRFG